MSVLKYAIMALVVLTVMIEFRKGGIPESLLVYKKIRITTVIQNLLVIGATIITIAFLYDSYELFRWGWYNLLFRDESAVNVHVAPMKIPFVGLVYGVIFLMVLPRLARIEEETFRKGTVNWYSGIKRSVVFGFVHMLVGVPLAAGIALIVPGIWYTYQYFKGGVERSTLHHTTYNMILVLVLIFNYQIT